MQSNQKKSLGLVLEHEGGYVNHPKDPGGATNKGVTQKTYDAYRQRKGLALRSVRGITQEELLEIYDQQYWDKVQGDKLPEGLDYCVFDYGVNSGPSRAAKDLQRELGVSADGVIGLQTLAVIDGMSGLELETLIIRLCDRRLRFLKSLKTWGTFGKGWASRVAGVREHSIAMVHGKKGAVKVPQALVKQASAPATEAKVAQLKTSEGRGLTAAGVGAAGQTVMTAADSAKLQIGDTLIGRIALVVFLLLILVGAGLIGYSYVKRIREAGGFGGAIKKLTGGSDEEG